MSCEIPVKSASSSVWTFQSAPSRGLRMAPLAMPRCECMCFMLGNSHSWAQGCPVCTLRTGLPWRGLMTWPPGTMMAFATVYGLDAMVHI